MKKIIVLFAASLSLFSQERMRLNEIQGSPTFVDDNQKFKSGFFPYVSLPLPTVGSSYRWSGQAVDVSVGLLGVDCAYSKIACFNKGAISATYQGFYSSIGIGGGVSVFDATPWLNVTPKFILPIRAGYQGQIGFVDLGIQMTYCPGSELMYYPVPLPELRGGVQF
jgi:hypothetical protein